MHYGIYISPWDRHDQSYGDSLKYNQHFLDQLREVLTNYPGIQEVWFDGACGEGPNGKKQEYDWPAFYGTIRKLQPKALIAMSGPDVRWVGNERGIAGDPCWATIDLGGIYPGTSAFQTFNTGSRSGTNWAPAECDVAIRPLWFYHPHEDTKVKSAVELVNIYYQSVGRGACLDLGLAPDKRGLIPDPDVASLREMGRMLNATFATNLLAGAKLEASNIRGVRPSPGAASSERRAASSISDTSAATHAAATGNGRTPYEPSNLLDGSRDTYWTTDDSILTPELVVTWPEAVSFNVVSLREYLPLGQRIDSVALDQWRDGEWQEFATATSIGNHRLIRTPRISTPKVRLRVTKASASPALSEFGLYSEPEEWRPKYFRAPGSLVGR
jgi:alpha-L-fucosidase